MNRICHGTGLARPMASDDNTFLDGTNDTNNFIRTRKVLSFHSFISLKVEKYKTSADQKNTTPLGYKIADLAVNPGQNHMKMYNHVTYCFVNCYRPHVPVTRRHPPMSMVLHGFSTYIFAHD